jgi:hypothetical protein
MSASSLAKQLINAIHPSLPGEVAVALLSAVPGDELPNILLNGPLFSGPNATSVALSHPKRARIIAASTDQLETQMELLKADWLENHEDIVVALVSSNLVTDKALIREIHDYIVAPTKVNSHRKADTLRGVLSKVDLDHALSYVESVESGRVYDVSNVAARVAAATADGDISTARRYATIVSHTANKRDADDAARVFGSSLGRAASGDHLADILDDVLSAFTNTQQRLVAVCAYERTSLVSKRTLQIVLDRVESKDEFTALQKSYLDSMSTAPLIQCPQGLKGENRLTDDALRLLAATYPGALLSRIEALSTEDEQRELYVQLLIESRRVDLAHGLLFNRHKVKNSSNGTVLNGSQFHDVVQQYLHGESLERPGTVKYRLHPNSLVESLPVDAAVSDIKDLMSVVQQDQVFLGLIARSEGGTDNMAFRPTPAQFEELLDGVVYPSRLGLLDSMLHKWNYLNHPKSDRSNAAGVDTDWFNSLVDVVAETVPASELASIGAAPQYIAYRISRSLGSDLAAWQQAVGLIPTAQMPLRRVLSAAKKL